LLEEGKSTQAMANCRGVSEKRVRNLLVKLRDRLEVKTESGISPRIALLNKARQLGLLPGSVMDANPVALLSRTEDNDRS
jgi:DNA-binding CsgD family transcriptional regulator